jgi:DNA-binding CsgD family transcriptional regulator
MPFGRKSDFWLSGDEVGAIVFISDPDAAAGDAADEVMDAYRLTPAEKNLLRELLAGHSLQEAADALNITRATSRNRLAQIMSKTDTQRQAQLLQLILRSTVPVR